ncbi:hypothetical protein K503DRAFT_767288 [Rhizopogon vinicolor AM-OR11-026]|uniref:Secreted protein n=1 Tax=Rhizopogon vinicolor AM-OR11-026 TaxID=1314800 RepID=A0A1B7NAI4_9AGAM|nr:hypothetical protein K503DRAFT_767288 [Rhizopogon vinicolor AM-OR11-026]
MLLVEFLRLVLAVLLHSMCRSHHALGLRFLRLRYLRSCIEFMLSPMAICIVAEHCAPQLNDDYSILRLSSQSFLYLNKVDSNGKQSCMFRCRRPQKNASNEGRPLVHMIVRPVS